MSNGGEYREKGCEMAKNNDNEAVHGVTRRDVIKGVGAGAAGLALTRTGPAQSGEVQGIDSARQPHASETVAKSDGHESRATPDGVDLITHHCSFYMVRVSGHYRLRFNIERGRGENKASDCTLILELVLKER